MIRQSAKKRRMLHMQRLADFYRVMLGTKGGPLFVQHFRQNTEKRFS